MGAMDSHGVVVTWTTEGRIHRPETGANHGQTVMHSQSWELFPSLELALQAGFKACWTCFPHRKGSPSDI